MGDKRKMWAAVASTALALAVAMPSVAFAATNTPSTTGRDTDGTTDLEITLASTDEATGSDENIAFSVPARIDFAMNSSGDILGPSLMGRAAYIENDSSYPIYLSAVKFTPEEGWTPMPDTSDADAVAAFDTSQANIFGLNVQIDDQRAVTALNTCLDRTPLVCDTSVYTYDNPYKMQGHAINNVISWTSYKIFTGFNGKAYNINKDLTTSAKLGVIQWYVSPVEATV